MLPYLTKVRSTRSAEPHLRGVIVGYGTIMWPHGPSMNGDGGTPRPVYLVQLATREGSAYGRSAAVIMHVNHVEELP